jgi:hypothetical protein
MEFLISYVFQKTNWTFQRVVLYGEIRYRNNHLIYVLKAQMA